MSTIRLHSQSQHMCKETVKQKWFNYFLKTKSCIKSRICVLAENPIGNAGTELWECVKLIDLMKETPVIWLSTHAPYGKLGSRTAGGNEKDNCQHPGRGSLFFSVYRYLMSMARHFKFLFRIEVRNFHWCNNSHEPMLPWFVRGYVCYATLSVMQFCYGLGWDLHACWPTIFGLARGHLGPARFANSISIPGPFH